MNIVPDFSRIFQFETICCMIEFYEFLIELIVVTDDISYC